MASEPRERILALNGSEVVDEMFPLAEAKLAAPRQRTGTVRRPRIVQTLDEGADSALTLVTAPAGYGKTTAVRAWCATSPAAVAWVTLDAGDNEPARLWTYFATAVDRIREGLGRRALKRLRATGMPIETPIDELMNGIAEFGRDLAIVLDDFQFVTSQESLRSLEYAIRRLPATARLIVITRADPVLGLARLRARGALAELRAGELSFTTDEARELLVDRAGLELDEREIEILGQRTEGWPAALYLAALWLRTIDDPHRAVREFGGNQRYVAQYLSHELIEALEPAERLFLLRAAVLGSFTPELCDRVLGRSDSALILAELARSNMFVVQLERPEWFRVHPLFAEFAATHLASSEPGAVEELHRSAARWLSARGMVAEAVEHAAAASDHEFVARLASEYHLTLIRNGRGGTVLRWVRMLPEAIVMNHPELLSAAGIAATLIGGLTLERRRLIQLALRARAERPERVSRYAECDIAIVRAAGLDAGVGDAVVQGRMAVELAQLGVDESIVEALVVLAHALYLAGELDEAWRLASLAIEHPDIERRAAGHILARSTLALAAVDLGRLRAARAHAIKAREIVGSISGSRSWLGAHAAVAVGAVLQADGELAGAEREFAYAERFFRDEVATIHHAALLVRLAEVRCQRGRLDQAAATLRELREDISEFTDSGTIPAAAAAVERQLDRARRQATQGEILEPPTDAELAVLQLLASDGSARQIAETLFLSTNTVKSHTRSLYRKLGVGSRTDAVARADALGLLTGQLPPDDSLHPTPKGSAGGEHVATALTLSIQVDDDALQNAR